MTAQPLDGKATAAAIKTELTTRVAALREHGVIPGLAIVLVGVAGLTYLLSRHWAFLRTQ